MPVDADRLVSVDTSVVIPLVVRTHEAHNAVTRWRAGRDLCVSGHAWIEAYSVLTRWPGKARLAPYDAVRVLESNFAPPIAVAQASWAGAVRMFAEMDIVGGAAHDAWVALAARDNDASLASRDARAQATYQRLGVDLEMVTAS
ncbi:PIN domain-containing protein [Acidiferrimicrobium sp. IK]|uniref:PIN domain-containing protein n=1 Tax=Acidiferrimicrobium sp. IK TaxID=2871700 RepID=UPI0021CB53CD|nr:PIN domain-containing protein [Acidiferrimicrobium sp. IK]MCU4183288.1 PIN domain-containing protein [Acidiferrimicrobium sp. IK]